MDQSILKNQLKHLGYEGKFDKESQPLVDELVNDIIEYRSQQLKQKHQKENPNEESQEILSNTFSQMNMTEPASTKILHAKGKAQASNEQVLKSSIIFELNQDVNREPNNLNDLSTFSNFNDSTVNSEVSELTEAHERFANLHKRPTVSLTDEDKERIAMEEERENREQEERMKYNTPFDYAPGLTEKERLEYGFDKKKQAATDPQGRTARPYLLSDSSEEEDLAQVAYNKVQIVDEGLTEMLKDNYMLHQSFENLKNKNKSIEAKMKELEKSENDSRKRMDEIASLKKELEEVKAAAQMITSEFQKDKANEQVKKSVHFKDNQDHKTFKIQIEDIGNTEESTEKMEQEKKHGSGEDLKDKLEEAQKEISKLKFLLPNVEEKELWSNITNKIEHLTKFSTDFEASLAKLENLKIDFLCKAEAPEELKKLFETVIERLKVEIDNQLDPTFNFKIVEKLNQRKLEAEQIAEKSTNRIKTLEKDLESHKQLNSELAKKIKFMNEKFTFAEKRENSFLAELTKFKQEILTRDSKVNQQQLYINELSEALKSCQKSVSQAQSEQDYLQSHISSQDQEISILKQKLEKANNELISVSLEMKQLKDQNANWQISVNEKSMLNGKLSVQLAQVLKESDKTANQLHEAQDRLKHLQDLLESKKNEKELMMITYLRIIQENEKLTLTLKTNNFELEKLQRETQSQKDLIEKLKRDNFSDESSIGIVKKALAEKEASFNQIKLKFEQTEQEKLNLESQIRSLSQEKKSFDQRQQRMEQAKIEILNENNRLNVEVAELQAQNQILKVQSSRPSQNQDPYVTEELEKATSKIKELENHLQPSNDHFKVEVLQQKVKDLEKEKSDLVKTISDLHNFMKSGSPTASSTADRLSPEKTNAVNSYLFIDKEKDKQTSKAALSEGTTTSGFQSSAPTISEKAQKRILDEINSTKNQLKKYETQIYDTTFTDWKLKNQNQRKDYNQHFEKQTKIKQDPLMNLDEKILMQLQGENQAFNNLLQEVGDDLKKGTLSSPTSQSHTSNSSEY